MTRNQKGYHPVVHTRARAVRVIAGISTFTAAVLGVTTVVQLGRVDSGEQPAAGVARAAADVSSTSFSLRENVSASVLKDAQIAANLRAAKAAAVARTAQRLAAKQARLKAQAQQAALARATAPFAFNLASFNILGSNHTRPGAEASHYAPGRIRTEWAADVVRTRSLDIVGFSEIQRDQLTAFMRTTGNAYDAWPGTALGGMGIPASVMWRKDRFTAVSKSSITIPFVGQRRPMPVVRLKDRQTGREFYVINAHNSPNSRQAERDAAMRIEIAKIKELRSQQKVPVFFFGDLNEKENALCKVTTQTDLVAASPTGNLTGCTGFRGMRLDWLFGSNVNFSGYTQDRGALVKKITDHAVVYARATVS
jgi:endonuclease/exonuclease/phosphatase family metal-dependent hydrolase